MKSRKAWVSRSNSGVYVAITRQKPIKDKHGVHLPGRQDADIMTSPEGFKTLFGFTPAKGSCEQMELSLKVIE